MGLIDAKAQPTDWLNEEDIVILPDRVILYVNNAFLSKYADMGSMLPTLGENTNGIKIKATSPSQINIGDLITYKEDGLFIVHRVVPKGRDRKGVYFITKGDNNTEIDGKVYWEQVEYVTIALIY
jgi:signal peptidase I